MFQLKRVYEAPARKDGLRILVDRLWPRGVRKDQAAIELWLKELAPSANLRKWFRHDPQKWAEFRKRYWAELKQQGDLLALLKHRASEGTVTLVYAARDEEHSHALALKQFLERRS